MKYEELPGIPKIWVDFMHSRLSFLPPLPTVQVLLEHRKAFNISSGQFGKLRTFPGGGEGNACPGTLKNIQKLQHPDTVAIVTNFYASLFGGPIYQILKCLTAIKVCEELEKRDVNAVPLCWISTDPPRNFAGDTVTLLDRRSELHTLKLQDSESNAFLHANRLPWSRISALLSQIDVLGQEAYDPEILGVLKSAFVPEANFAAASERLISDLMSEWGMIVLNAGIPESEAAKEKALVPALNSPGKIDSVIHQKAAEMAGAGYEEEPSGAIARALCVQNSLLPILGMVLDPLEIGSYIAALPLLDEAGLPSPVVWPQPSVTITDTRRRRILARYNLSLRQLYSGEEEVAGEIGNTIPNSAAEILNDLKSKVDECILELETLAPSRKRFTKKSALCREKILYQLEKIGRHHADARAKREQTVNRQIHKACNLLAPKRRLQERELAGIQIPLRYSRAGLRSLYEKLDISSNTHQLISMD